MQQTSHFPTARPFEALLSLEQAAKLLGLHPDTLTNPNHAAFN